MSDGAPAGRDSEQRMRKLVHDLRTPATVIGGFADLLRRGGDDLAPERRAEYIAWIAEGADELRAILDAQRPDPGE
jgi:signal transduction histidine kinase